METAPRDGRGILLLFSEGMANVQGPDSRRKWLPRRELLSRWWSACEVNSRIGTVMGLRKARLELDGGYWGALDKPTVRAGLPVGWRSPV